MASKVAATQSAFAVSHLIKDDLPSKFRFPSNWKIDLNKTHKLNFVIRCQGDDSGNNLPKEPLKNSNSLPSKFLDFFPFLFYLLIFVLHVGFDWNAFQPINLLELLVSI